MMFVMLAATVTGMTSSDRTGLEGERYAQRLRKAILQPHRHRSVTRPSRRTHRQPAARGHLSTGRAR